MEKMSGTVMHLWDAEAEIQRKKTKNKHETAFTPAFKMPK